MNGMEPGWAISLTLCLLMSLVSSALILGASALVTRFLPAARDRHLVWWAALVLCALPVLLAAAAATVPQDANVTADTQKTIFRVLPGAGGIGGNIAQTDGALLAVRLIPVLYVIGLAWRCAALLRGWVRLRRLLADRSPVDDAALTQNLDAWRERLGLSFLPPLCKTGAAISPFLAGWRRPMLVLPDALLARHEETELICAHELAHLRRGDTWLVPVQRILSTVLWFNPFAQIIAHRLNTSREAACDALVLDHDVRRRQDYARALLTALRLASLRDGRTAAPGIPLIHPGRRDHEMRLRAILHHRPKTAAPLRTFLCSGLLLASLGPVAVLQAAVADEAARPAAGEAEACNEHPVAVHQPPPAYPHPGLEGRVVVEFAIGADGRTKDVKVVKSTDERLNKAAVDAVKQWRYEPPCVEGKEFKGVRGIVKGEGRKGMKIVIEFKMNKKSSEQKGENPSAGK